MKALRINDKDLTDREIISKIGSAKDNMQTPSAYMREHETTLKKKR